MRFMEELFSGIKMLGTFNAQHVRKAAIREGQLDGGAVMETHAIFRAGFACAAGAPGALAPPVAAEAST